MRSFKNKKILIIVSHPDDAEISMGMLMHKMCSEDAQVDVLCISQGETKALGTVRKNEAIKAGKLLGVNKYNFFNISDRYFIEERKKVNSIIFENLQLYKPDIIFTHFYDDLHPDHVVTSKETFLAASTISSDLYYFKSPYSQNFNPNTYFFGNENLFNKKLLALKEYKSQSQLNLNIIKDISRTSFFSNLHYKEIENLMNKSKYKNFYAELFILQKQIILG